MDIDIMILYEDNDIVVLNKPSGMLTIPDRFKKELPNLYDMLNLKYGRAFIVHRLDRDTSGVIVFAKNAEAHRNLSMKWEDREIVKSYLAIVEGEPVKEHDFINLRIGPLKKKKGVMEINRRAGKVAVTEYKVLEKYGDFALVEALPRTGRTHQIRVHLAAIGNPLAIDPLYNREAAAREMEPEQPQAPLMSLPKKKRENWMNLKDFKAVKTDKPHIKASELPIKRLTLHAKSISFVHPSQGANVIYEAPVPDDFKATVEMLETRK
ncbi:MAG: RluA family pseudouridine synthase [Spirochaetia bacterium]|nr:RluA family pseudouridine synthase [Spirochaetia bacterium]